MKNKSLDKTQRGKAPTNSAFTESEPPKSPEDLALCAAMRERKTQNPVTLRLAMLGDEEQPDTRLAEYLASVIRDVGPELWTHVGSKLDDREAACLGESVALAEEVSGYYDALSREKKDPYATRPFPRDFCIPGYAGYQVIQSTRDLLCCLAEPMNKYREAIRERILEPMTNDPYGQLELVEALVIAQAVVDRKTGDEETEACERANTNTRMVQLSWKIKAHCYARKLLRAAAEREVALAADHAEDCRRTAA